MNLTFSKINFFQPEYFIYQLKWSKILNLDNIFKANPTTIYKKLNLTTDIEIQLFNKYKHSLLANYISKNNYEYREWFKKISYLKNIKFIISKWNIQLANAEQDRITAWETEILFFLRSKKKLSVPFKEFKFEQTYYTLANVELFEVKKKLSKRKTSSFINNFKSMNFLLYGDIYFTTKRLIIIKKDGHKIIYFFKKQIKKIEFYEKFVHLYFATKKQYKIAIPTGFGFLFKQYYLNSKIVFFR